MGTQAKSILFIPRLRRQGVGFGASIVMVAEVLRVWRERRRARRGLRAILTLDEHTLRDIGVNRHDLLRDARRLYWW